MLRLSGPLTQHPERTLLPTHGQFPPTNLGRSLEPFPKPLSTHTHRYTHTYTWGQATYALGLGKPIDSSTSRLEPHFTEPGRFWRSLRGRILLYRSSLAAMVPAGYTLSPPLPDRRLSPWAAAGGSVCERSGASRATARGRSSERSGAESDGARPHGELNSAHRRKRRMRRGGWPTEYYQTQHAAHHNTAHKHMTQKGSQKHFSV